MTKKAELKQLMETITDEEEVAIDAIPLAVKSSRIIDWKIHKEGKKSYYQIGRIVRIKSLLDAVGITVAQVYVDTALMKWAAPVSSDFERYISFGIRLSSTGCIDGEASFYLEELKGACLLLKSEPFRGGERGSWSSWNLLRVLDRKNKEEDLGHHGIS
uniref:Uncharacterized protein n=1 Tax=Tanacetum cinerariifolium TaxID=118510 RepID=A0A699HK60_TANCI|nr:hypothetical protein [Tanacetum cinerariifolium]